MQRFHRSLIGAAASAAALSAFFVSAVSAEVPSNEVPAGLKAAIQQQVESEGHDYAGLCRDIEQHNHVGEYCAFVLNIEGNAAEVTYGPVLSEPTAHVTFLNINGQWTHPGGGPGEGPVESPIPASLRAAIEDFVESRGHTYAGICGEIAQDGSNIGKYCGIVLEIAGNTAKVAYAPVATNDVSSVTFTENNGTWTAPVVEAPYWVNDLDYGSSAGGFYWDSESNLVWTSKRGWHSFDPAHGGGAETLWVNHLSYGSAGGGFYLDPVAGQVWTAERGWHEFSLR